MFFNRKIIRETNYEECRICTYLMHDDSYLTRVSHGKLKMRFIDNTLEEALTRHSILLDKLYPEHASIYLNKFTRRNYER